MSSRNAIIMLALLLITSLSPVLANNPISQDDSEQNIDDSFTLTNLQHNFLSTLNEEQKLQLAVDHWSQMTTPQSIESDLKPSTGMLNLAIGSFDPLSEQLPLLDSNLLRYDDNLVTGLAIIQLFSHDGAVLESL